MKISIRGVIFFILMSFVSSCTSVFYQGDRNLYATPDQGGLDYQEVKIKAEDGNINYGWFIHKKGRKGKGLVIQNHGNAQNMSSHFRSLAWLVNEGFDLFVWDYRGYGKSEGESYPEGVYLDAKAALSWAHNKAKEYPQFIVFGQSLGGAITMRAVEEDPFKKDIDLVVLDSTFTSYKGVAVDRLQTSFITYLLSPLGYILVSNKYAQKTFLDEYKGKVLVIHGTRDPIVPYEFGEAIFKELKTSKKTFWKVLNGSHIDVFDREKKKYQKSFLTLLKTIH